MRVWLPTLRAGSGSDVFAQRLASGLRAAGVDANLQWFGQKFEMAPWLLSFAQAPEGTTIIHTNAAYAFAFKRPGIPLVATELHYLLDPTFRPFKTFSQDLYHRLLIGRFAHMSYARANAVTAISQFTARVLHEVGKVDVTAAIPLWVDLKAFSPAAKPRDSLGRFRLLFVGNSSLRKGADVVPILASMLGAEFEIVCTSGLRAKMSTSMPENVRVLGRLTTEELVNEYRNCDAVLVPSRYEGFGYAALEGMACGKPVVGFRCEAVTEVVGSEGAGLLSEIDDLAGLAESCRSLSLDRVMTAELGQRGRARAEATYSAERAIREYVSIYEALAKQSSN